MYTLTLAVITRVFGRNRPIRTIAWGCQELGCSVEFQVHKGVFRNTILVTIVGPENAVRTLHDAFANLRKK